METGKKITAVGFRGFPAPPMHLDAEKGSRVVYKRVDDTELLEDWQSKHPNEDPEDHGFTLSLFLPGNCHNVKV